MTCLHCSRDLRPCHEGQRPHRCTGFVHDHNGSHVCTTEHLADPDTTVRPVHLITAALGNACGHAGHDPASSAPADVTCYGCKRTPAWQQAVG